MDGINFYPYSYTPLSAPPNSSFVYASLAPTHLQLVMNTQTVGDTDTVSVWALFTAAK
jgi:hypothetical protein